MGVAFLALITFIYFRIYHLLKQFPIYNLFCLKISELKITSS